MTEASTPASELDRVIGRLHDNAREFARAPLRSKLGWLGEMKQRLAEVAPELVRESCLAKGLDPTSALSGEEWLGGPAVIMRCLRLLERSLQDVDRHGAPHIDPKQIQERDGGLSVEVVPANGFEKALFPGVSCTVTLRGSFDRNRFTEDQARFYRQVDPEGAVTLVLGAGNVASIPPTDALHKMFVEGQVCLLKMNPINAYLGPHLERVFAPLIERGYFAVVQGGAEVGAYLCQHAGIDEVHITGSDKTHDEIVWGPPSAERVERKRRGDPVLKKKITSELGCISPVLVVPGEYTDGELESMAENIAGMVTFNASFNCNAAKFLVLAKGWTQRETLLGRIGAILKRVPPRKAFYPGARERYLALTGGREGVLTFGEDSPDALPWAVVAGLDPSDTSLPHFKLEPFCPVLSETSVGSPEPDEFLRVATDFANQQIWGTLSAMVFAHPRLDSDPKLRAELERALRELRYGSVCVNLWAGMTFGLVSPPWGAYPGSTLEDIQSGRGWVHNSYMFQSIEKSILRGPLKPFPKHVWFPGHGTLRELGQKLVDFERSPSWRKIPGLALSAVRA